VFGASRRHTEDCLLLESAQRRTPSRWRAVTELWIARAPPAPAPTQLRPPSRV